MKAPGPTGRPRRWAQRPAEPTRYPLLTRLADMYQGRRDGRKGIPQISPTTHPADAYEAAQQGGTGQPGGAGLSGGAGQPGGAGLSGGAGQPGGAGLSGGAGQQREHPQPGDAARPGGTRQPGDAGQPGDAAWDQQAGQPRDTGQPQDTALGRETSQPQATEPVETPRLEAVRSTAGAQMELVRIRYLEDYGPLYQALGMFQARSEALARKADIAAQALRVAQEPLTDEDLKERRVGEQDPHRHPDTLVRGRLAGRARQAAGRSRARLSDRRGGARRGTARRGRATRRDQTPRGDRPRTGAARL